MKKLLTAASIFLSFSSCSTWARTEMQPDHSYRIEATGENWASHDKVKATAYKASDALCPKGYEKSAEFGQDSMVYTLIILCNDRTPVRTTSQ